tara:strand:- start:1262 stop:3160 length:1899 start_codon:yes stop_codon:yes gene_type:complete
MQRFKEFLGEAYTIRPVSKDDLESLRAKYTPGEYEEIEKLWDIVNRLNSNFAGPLIFDDGKLKPVKVHNDTGLSVKKEIKDSLKNDEDFKKLTKITIVGGTGSSKNTDEYYIAPGQTATKFYEQWSSIGLLQTEYSAATISSWISDLSPSMIGDTTGEIPEAILELYKTYYSAVQGQKDFTKEIPGHYTLICSILIGSANFRSDYSSFFSKGGISIVNGNIDSYYAKMKSNYGDLVDKKDKENTADAVVFNGGLSVESLMNDPISFEDDGVITFSSGKQMMQISMKKGRDEARIGKIKDLLTAWQVWSPNKKTDKLDAYVKRYTDLSAEFQLGGMILDEGILDLIRAGAKYAREGVSKLASSISSIFSTIFRGVKTIIKRFDVRRETENLLSKYSIYITEARKKKISQQKQLEALAKSPPAIKQLNTDLQAGVETVSQKINQINRNVSGIKELDIKALQFLQFPIEPLGVNPDYDDVRMVFFNILSFDIISDILDKIIDSEDMYDEALDRFVGMYRSSVMGNTKLPVIKVFGTNVAGEKSYQVYTRDDFDEKQKQVSEKIIKKTMSLGGLKLNVQGRYYVIYFYIAGELKGEGDNAKLTYNNVRPTAYGGTQFKVEIDSTVDESVFKKQFGL